MWYIIILFKNTKIFIHKGDKPHFKGNLSLKPHFFRQYKGPRTIVMPWAPEIIGTALVMGTEHF